MSCNLLKLFVAFSILAFSVAGSVKENQEGYNVGCVKCHSIDENKINVHLIPHSHDDVGWLNTEDEYFYGENSGKSVSLIITSVIDALKRNPERRFIQVETAFFNDWWNENENMREDFKFLVDNGQIEMVNGAWAMNDEACVNYQSTIDNFAWGLRKIRDTVGICGKPRVGWQIDPFGHSREHASLLSQMGYDGVFFARIDHDDRSKRFEDGELEFLWKGSENMDDSTIFASCFPVHYSAPSLFCWDINCNDDEIIDNSKSTLYNVEKKVKDFSNRLQSYYPNNATKNIIVPMGDDFQYQGAEKNFKNMDLLIKGFQNFSDEYNVFYSTPSCYIKAVNDEKPTFTLKTDDFFPYSDISHGFWTGYYTSRPTVKRFERTGHNILQATKQLYALSSNRSHDEKLEDLRETMGVLQHHDAITGTETQNVTYNYVSMLTAAIKEAEEPVATIINEILNSNVSLNLSSCLLANMSICSISQNNEKFVVVVYNPLAWKTTHYIRLPVEQAKYEINGPDGIEKYDLLEALYSFNYVKITNETPSSYEMVFAARDIPPLGFKIYHIQKGENLNMDSENNLETDFESSVFELDNQTNLLKSVTLNGITLNINQSFYFYVSETNEGQNDTQLSGAYIFRPYAQKVFEFSPDATKIREFSGEIVEEVHLRWESPFADVYESIRWYKNENYLEFDWIVGNIINMDEMVYGKDVISLFTIDDFDNEDIFYTDSNGREMLKRTKNERPTYSYNSSEEPVSSNYYPVTSRIVIKDEQKNLEVAILTDRSQGGSSLERGQIELMLHRSLLSDDDRGVNEFLDENEFSRGIYARGSHYLIFGQATQDNKNTTSTAAQERILAQKKLVQPWVGLSPTDKTFGELNQSMELTYSALKEEFPENINILTLEPWTDNSHLLRLEHIMEKDDDPVLSNSTTIPDIKNLFKTIKVREITEMGLAAHLTLKEIQERGKYSWNTVDGLIKSEFQKSISDEGAVTLNSMEIRTFILETGPNSNSGYTKSLSFIGILVSLLLVYQF